MSVRDSSSVEGMYVYVSGNTGKLVCLEAFTDNEEAKSWVIGSLQCRGGNARLMARKLSREVHALVSGRSLGWCEIIERCGPTMEGFGRTCKIRKQEIEYDFLEQIFDLGELFESSLQKLKKMIKKEHVFDYEKMP